MARSATGTGTHSGDPTGVQPPPGHNDPILQTHVLASSSMAPSLRPGGGLRPRRHSRRKNLLQFFSRERLLPYMAALYPANFRTLYRRSSTSEGSTLAACA
jgi:hypothetical protein